jgi:electron transfer flavoprotein alpha subunit
MAQILVLAETNGTDISLSTLPAITFAQQLAGLVGSKFAILALGEAGLNADSLRSYGAELVLTATDAALAHPTADNAAVVTLAAIQQTGANSLIGTSSAFGRDVLPRVAALRDLPMLSDVLSVENSAGGMTFRRPMNAGNFTARVQIEGDGGVFSVRGTAFGAPQQSDTQSPVQSLALPALSQKTRWIGLEAGEQKRPDLTNARVVVSGGRPLRDAETFERLLGGLADALGGAVGATRAAVDSGIAPNELQVGQTGKVVAPDLYIAAGVSGSVQHLAGMKESKVIVAINSDADAPIFEVADYGLVADLHQALPELTAKVK